MLDPFGLLFEELPEELTIFPLPGILLLPGGRLPLNVFERRYLDMVLDGLKEQRLIGIVQTVKTLSDPIPNSAEIKKIGCVGRIVSFAETQDGRLMITLEGICRFRITSELENRNGYRRIRTDYREFEADTEELESLIERESLLDILSRYFEAKHIEVDWPSLEKTSDRLLIATLGMMCPFNDQEKQALLEAQNFIHMTQIMTSLMEMALQGVDQSSAKH